MEDVLTPPTATSEPSAAPAPSTPVAAEPTVTTDRPSFKDALSVFHEAERQQGKRGRTPVPVPSAAPAEAVTAAPDGTAAVGPAPVSPKGPVPFAVHDTALKNARTKERQAVEQEFRTTYGDPQAVRTATQWFQRAAQDRVGFLAEVINEALADPQLAPQIASLAGRTLGGDRQPVSAPDAEPQPDLTDGQGHSLYSAQQLQARDAWLRSQLTADILAQVQPDLDQVRADREQQAQARQQQAVATAIHRHIAEVRQLPYYDRFKADIAEAVRQMPLTSGHPAEEGMVLRRAYDRVVGPKLSELEQARVIADLRTRANASSLNPASTGAPSGVPKTVRAKDGGTFGAALEWARTQTAGR